MSRKIFILIASVSVLIIGTWCASAAVPFLDPMFGYSKISDIAYATPSSNMLDLYRPNGTGLPAKLPGFIFLHGYGGDKADPKPSTVCINYTKRGYVCASINYDLYSGKSAADAVRWMRANAATYNIDPDRIAIGGGSAGATTVMLAAYQEASVVGTNAQIGVLLDLWGTLLGQEGLIDADDPPIFIAHGTADETVSISASYSIVARCQRIGLDYQFFPIEGAGHSCFDEFWSYMVDGKTVDRHCAEFFYKHLDLENINPHAPFPLFQLLHQ